MRHLDARLRFERFAAALVCVCATSLVTAADSALSPFLGKWNLNAARSSAEGAELPKTYTVESTDAGDGKMRNKVVWVSSDGTREQLEYTAAADGKPAAMTGAPDIDSVIVTHTGARTIHIRFMKDHKQVESGRYTVSPDGKVMRGTEGGIADGKKYRYHITFDRQQARDPGQNRRSAIGGTDRRPAIT